MKKFLTVFFTFTLYFNLVTQANAASFGGWSMSNPVAQGASVLYNGSKNVIINGANVAKTSTALITPTATSVAKLLAKGVAGVALSVAVEQLLGAVDWVLDPANNRVIYTDPLAIPDPENSVGWEKLWRSSNGKDYPTMLAAGQANCIAFRMGSNPTFEFRPDGKYSVFCSSGQAASVSSRPNPAYDPAANTPVKKYLPIDTVAAQVISNAESNTDKRAAAQVATMAAAADMVAEAESDNVKARPIVSQLDANAKTETDADGNTATGSQTQNPTKPETTDLKLEFPKFCGWAPIVCEAAQVAIAFPRLVTGWWETIVEKTNSWATSISESWASVKEWAKSEESKDTELEIPDPIQPPIDTDISFGGICPADHEAQINMGVGVIKMPISYEPICTTVSTAKPVLIFVGFFIAALIIGGVKTE